MSDTPLFFDDDCVDEPTPPRQREALPPAPPRLRRADRRQMTMRPCSLEELLHHDHDARTVWTVVSSWDLSRFLETIRARGEDPGRAATDPSILIALWLYAATQGVASARELDRLCRESDPYRWICGGVSMNYHTLSDFRVGHKEALDGLLTQMLAVLIQAQVVSVERIAQDGTRVRVSAGAGSFKRRDTLEQARQKAEAHLKIIDRQADRLEEATVRKKKAQHRAAKEKLERIEEALKQLAEVEQAKAQQKDKPSKKNEPRASTTDPDTRFMRMPDRGTRPAFNVQLAVDTESRVIVDSEVTNAGSDAGQSEPMRKDVQERTEQKVKEQLLDGGFVKLDAIDQATADGTTVYMPVPKPRKKGCDPHQPKEGDSKAVATWRERMGTDEAKAIYKERSSTIETVNAELKTHRGLGPFNVRGLDKARCVVLWSVLAYNIVHFGSTLVELVRQGNLGG
jgi:transposase